MWTDLHGASIFSLVSVHESRWCPRLPFSLRASVYTPLVLWSVVEPHHSLYLPPADFRICIPNFFLPCEACVSVVDYLASHIHSFEFFPYFDTPFQYIPIFQ